MHLRHVHFDIRISTQGSRCNVMSQITFFFYLHANQIRIINDATLLTITGLFSFSLSGIVAVFLCYYTESKDATTMWVCGTQARAFFPRGNWTPMGIVYLQDKLSHALCAPWPFPVMCFSFPHQFILEAGAACCTKEEAKGSGQQWLVMIKTPQKFHFMPTWQRCPGHLEDGYFLVRINMVACQSRVVIKQFQLQGCEIAP